VYYDCFDLKIVYERNRTGFEETKDFPIEINGVIAGRYQILEFLGAAAFSKAIQVTLSRNSNSVTNSYPWRTHLSLDDWPSCPLGA
jgi:hypothetical protein